MKPKSWLSHIGLILVATLMSCGKSRHEAARPKNIFGPDDRLPVTSHAYPYNAIGRLSIGCTATLITRQMILTAAHCVFNFRGERTSRNLMFTLNQIQGEGPNSYFTTLLESGTTVPYSDVATYDQDWAVLALDRPVSTAHQPLSLATANPVAGDRISIIGYSGDYENGRTATAHFNCHVQGRNNQSFLHDCDVMGGASGAAVLRQSLDGKSFVIIGIESGERRLQSGGDGRFEDYTHENANVAVSSAVFVSRVQSQIRSQAATIR
jgi:V8-like Glu-specific endopeptidase